MAKWKPFDLTWGRSIYYCTECKEGIEVPTSCGKPMYKFCPMCGARMDTADTPQTKTQTETQNSNLTFENRTMRDCYNCKRYEAEGECIECNYEPKDEPQTERRCGNCKHLTYRWNKTWCDIKCDNPHDMVCDKWERSE